jgi:hypothetical protein
MRTYRPRISLLTALLLMTIIGMTIVIVQLWREVAPLRAEVRALRDETGRLSITNPTQFHAIRVRTDDDYVWKWRVWVPEGREYRINLAAAAIPKTGFPIANGMVTLNQPGESWIEYRISKSPDSDRWSDRLLTPNGSVGGSGPSWVTWKRQTSTGEGVSYNTESMDSGKPIVLARQRVSEKATDSRQIEDPAAGFMIWLEPVK